MCNLMEPGDHTETALSISLRSLCRREAEPGAVQEPTIQRAHHGLRAMQRNASTYKQICSRGCLFDLQNSRKLINSEIFT